MFQSPDYRNTLSVKLSEVLEDVGVNEKMIMKRRRTFLLHESIQTIFYRPIGKDITVYCLGSQSEGTTTLGLESDIDQLFVDHEYNVIQDWSEWKQNKINLLMIQDEDVTPGYCFLQLLRSDEPTQATDIPNEDYISDSRGRILFTNNIFTLSNGFFVRQGPSNAVCGRQDLYDVDTVIALPCSSWPHSASHFLDRQGIGRWRSPEIIRYVASNGCFVVGASSKISSYPDLEWRVSTSLAERCLMFNLNITQLQCYILMKMMLKSLLNPRKENSLSSFMCKTVLLHCIENTEQSIWMKNNLSTCLTYCLVELHSCVQNDNCPHFFIPENNLMAGQLNVENKHAITRKISDILQNECRYLFQIDIDSVGDRLRFKMNTFPLICQDFVSPHAIHEKLSSVHVVDLASRMSGTHLKILQLLPNVNIQNLRKSIYNLQNYSASGNILEHLASRYIVPFLCTTLGSMLVSSSIGRNNSVSPQTLKWLSLGLNSDAISGKLKLASVFFCTGDMYRAEFILRETERQYNPDTVVPVCDCRPRAIQYLPVEFMRICSESSENCINHITSYCIRFHRTEVNCVPRELQYELMRSTRDDRPYRNILESRWMDFAVVELLPYLYFLQYKTYGYLQRHQDQQYALNNLVITTLTGENFRHRETALNLLGQCMEQECKLRQALQCYMLSIQEKPRNNAAKIHLCSLLAKCVNLL